MNPLLRQLLLAACVTVACRPCDQALAQATEVSALPGATLSREHDAKEADAKEADAKEADALEPESDYLALADTPLFLPRNYLYWGTPVGPRGHREPLIFGLEYALHLPVYNNVRAQLLRGLGWAGAVTLSFEGALRMLSTVSKPVRMPSYRPSLSGQLFYAWHREHPLLFGLRSSLYHYSNGQERCSFDETLTDTSRACLTTIRTTRNLRESLNRTSGNFSTTGWLLELHGRIHQVNSYGVALGHLSLGLGYAGFFTSFAGALDPPTRALYGKGRVEGSVEGKRRLGWASLTARGAVSHYVQSDPRVPSTAGQMEVVLSPYWLTGLGFFARYYGGRDSYNAFFVDRLQQFSAGVAWDGERPLKFWR